MLAYCQQLQLASLWGPLHLAVTACIGKYRGTTCVRDVCVMPTHGSATPQQHSCWQEYQALNRASQIATVPLFYMHPDMPTPQSACRSMLVIFL